MSSGEAFALILALTGETPNIQHITPQPEVKCEPYTSTVTPYEVKFKTTGVESTPTVNCGKKLILD